MNIAGLSWRYLWARPLSAALNLCLLSLGLASMAFILLAHDRVERAFERDLAGIDAVVGAKGSPMQLILSGVFHIDAPTGNVPLAAVSALRQHPWVAEVIPLSLGDNLNGFRIVGTEPAYLALYQGRLAEGRLWAQPMEALLGDGVARATGLGLGAAFAGAHGLGQGGPVHGEQPYRVVGRLARCACVLDSLVLTATESVWQVHEQAHEGDGLTPQEQAELATALAEQREVTVALVRYQSPLAATSFVRYVNQSTAMQAAAPALEVARLLGLVAAAVVVLQAVGALLLLVAGLSVLMALLNAVRERRSDLALLRLLGASPARLVALLGAEAAWLALLACGAGLLLAQAAMAILEAWAAPTQWGTGLGLHWVAALGWVPVVAALVAAMAVALPAWQAYRLAVMTALKEG